MYNNSFYQSLNKPSFTPKSFIFKIVWPIIYVLMFISLIIVLLNKGANKENAVLIFLFQLFLNIIWSPLFFVFKRIKAALFISFILTISILVMIFEFYMISKVAGIIQIPYFIWVCFATILNYFVVKMNKDI